MLVSANGARKAKVETLAGPTFRASLGTHIPMEKKHDKRGEKA
jgi:hypothetical protein